MTTLRPVVYPNPETGATHAAIDFQRALADAGWLTSEPTDSGAQVFSPDGEREMTIEIATDLDGFVVTPIRFRLIIGGRQVSFRMAHDYIEGEA